MPSTARITAASVLVAGLLAPAVAAARPTAPDPAQRVLAHLTLDQKIGQVFETYAYGDSATTTDPNAVAQNQALYGVDNGAQLVARYHLGVGHLLHLDRATSARRRRSPTLSNGLQHAAADNGEPPLLISTDQEGGNVTRIGAPLAVSPGNMAIGATFNPFDSYAMSYATGQQLAALGINVDDAPVVDVNTNPANSADGPRSFGDRAAMVSVLVRGVRARIPARGRGGHRQALPRAWAAPASTPTTASRSPTRRVQEFERNDLPPFRAAIAAGTDEIMAAHIIAPALDPSGAPASVSKPIVTGLLRDKLHYNGVVVTDALSAAALESIPPAQRAVQALKAGDDVLLMPEDLPASIDAVRAAVQSGEISRVPPGPVGAAHPAAQGEARPVRQPVRRRHRRAGPGRDARPARHRGPHRQRLDHAAAQLGRHPAAGPEHRASTSSSPAGDPAPRRPWPTRSPRTASRPSGSTPARTRARQRSTPPSPRRGRATTSWSPRTTPGPIRASRRWSARWKRRKRRSSSSSLGGPYDLAYVPDAPTFIAAYGYQPATLTALVADLFGARAEGTSPGHRPQPGRTLGHRSVRHRPALLTADTELVQTNVVIWSRPLRINQVASRRRDEEGTHT